MAQQPRLEGTSDGTQAHYDVTYGQQGEGLERKIQRCQEAMRKTKLEMKKIDDNVIKYLKETYKLFKDAEKENKIISAKIAKITGSRYSLPGLESDPSSSEALRDCDDVIRELERGYDKALEALYEIQRKAERKQKEKDLGQLFPSDSKVNSQRLEELVNSTTGVLSALVQFPGLIPRAMQEKYDNLECIHQEASRGYASYVAIRAMCTEENNGQSTPDAAGPSTRQSRDSPVDQGNGDDEMYA